MNPDADPSEVPPPPPSSTQREYPVNARSPGNHRPDWPAMRGGWRLGTAAAQPTWHKYDSQGRGRQAKALQTFEGVAYLLASARIQPPHRCRANMAHTTQSRPGSGRGFQAKTFSSCSLLLRFMLFPSREVDRPTLPTAAERSKGVRLFLMSEVSLCPGHVQLGTPVMTGLIGPP